MINELAWYKLLNVKGLGAKSLLFLYHTIKNNAIQVNDIFDMSENDFYHTFTKFGSGKFSRVKYENFQELEEDKITSNFQNLINNNIVILPLNDSRYSNNIKKRLKADAPPVLFCKGNLSLLNSKNISIVGSRDTDDYSLNLTRNLASNLTKIGFNIVSGYAKGVDTNAHIGALQSEGTTTVVLSLGINNLSIKSDFKKNNYEEKTLFISQFLPFERWSGRNAMTRNKIVTSMSEAVIVITSGPAKDKKGRMSGTFDAGKSAIEMGIPVFVLNPDNLQNSPIGNKDLINIGGIPFDNVNDIVNSFQNKSLINRLKVPKQMTIF